MRNVLILMNGLTGAGKSSTAKLLSEQFRLSLYQSCVVRRKRFGISALMSPPKRFWVYDEMLCLASESAKAGRGIVLDGSFNKRGLRQMAYKWANEYSLPIIIVECVCPNQALIAERLKTRRLQMCPEAEADSMEIYRLWRRQSETPHKDLLPDDQPPAIVTYDTQNDTTSLSLHYLSKVAPQVAQVAEFLGHGNFMREER